MNKGENEWNVYSHPLFSYTKHPKRYKVELWKLGINLKKKIENLKIKSFSNNKINLENELNWEFRKDNFFQIF